MATAPSANARTAARSQMELMKQFGDTGLPIFRSGLEAVRGRLAENGLPGYVQKAYAGADTSALEAANRQTIGGVAAARAGSPEGGAQLGRIASIFTGGARALAQERSGTALARAAATVSDRAHLVSMLGGGGFQATDISAGFGGLTNRALAGSASGGNPIYEAVLGGTAVGSQLAISALTPRGGAQLVSPASNFSAMGFNPDASTGLGALYSMPRL